MHSSPFLFWYISHTASSLSIFFFSPCFCDVACFSTFSFWLITACLWLLYLKRLHNRQKWSGQGLRDVSVNVWQRCAPSFLRLTPSAPPPPPTFRSSVNCVAVYLWVVTDWWDDCRVATPTPTIPPWCGAIVWCRVGGVVWGPAGYSGLWCRRGKACTGPHMHRGQWLGGWTHSHSHVKSTLSHT